MSADGAVEEPRREIATVRDWDGLIDALRQRAHSLDISREALDELTGLQPGYTAKLLSPVPVRKLGPLSFGLLLQALDCELVMVPAGNVSNRVSKRARRVLSSGEHVWTIKRTRRMFRRMAKKAVGGRMKKILPERRREIAQRAAIARWQRTKAESRADAAQIGA